jgi:hypothetical protein
MADVKSISARQVPACNIRRDCRWFRQEGRAACQRCPQIATGNPEADERLKEFAGMPEGATVPGPAYRGPGPI